MAENHDELDGNGWFITKHVLDQTLPDGFPVPELHKRDRSDFAHVGSDGWAGYWPPEDSAVQPHVAWTEAHEVLVLAAYRRTWGRFLEANQTYEIVWPPEAYLTTDGSVVTGPLTCVGHDDEHCEECDEFQNVNGNVEPAEWTWSATIETHEWNGDSGSVDGTERFHFLTTLVDPRAVDYER